MEKYDKLIDVLSKIYCQLFKGNFFNLTKEHKELYFRSIYGVENYVTDEVENLVDVKINTINIRFNKFVFEHLIYLLGKNPGYEINSENKNFLDLEVHPSFKNYLNNVIIEFLKELGFIIVKIEDLIKINNPEDLEFLFKEKLQEIFYRYTSDVIKYKNEYFKIVDMFNSILKRWDVYAPLDQLYNLDNSIFIPIVKYLDMANLEELVIGLEKELENLSNKKENNNNDKKKETVNDDEVIKFITSQLDNLGNVKELNPDLIREEVYKYLKEKLKK